MNHWRTRAGILALSAAACLAGCMAAPAAGRPASHAGSGIQPGRPAAPAAGCHAMICAAPAASLADEPVTIKVSGLTPGARVSLRARSVDANGVAWSSSAVFRAGRGGMVDPARSAALSGSYTGVSAMGLFWSMQPRGRSPDGAYSWAGTTASSFVLSVVVHGRARASAALFRRLSATAVEAEPERPATAGFYGEFYSPAVTGRRPALLVVGGTDGGLSASTLSLAALLAAHGYPALALAYYGEPGLRPALSDIPLEYFATALGWLRRQPHVDPGHVLALGVSRGSEAALLLGAYFPRLVGGVVASVPSDAANISFPCCAGAAWTLHGRPLPYTRQFGNPHPTDNPAAVIPVEQINGPVFLDCGGSDLVWHSCRYARAIMRRLAAHHDAHRHVLYSYPAAGHNVGTLVPYQPVADAILLAQGAGATADANPDAQAELWPHLLRFLAGLSAAR
jgi:dienelactone hydrolase